MAIKVGIIEDEASILELYRLKLTMEGFEVATAVNGAKGFHMLDEFRPQLALVDIRMPGMNGDEMLAKLRATDWGAEMRVIVLTNLSKDEAPTILRFLNIDRYIVKAHYTPAQVVTTVREVLGLE